MLTNLRALAERASTVNRIIRTVTAEIQEEHERTKRACQNCIYYAGSSFLLCAVRPEGGGVPICEINDCPDWELKAPVTYTAQELEYNDDSEPDWIDH